MNPMEQRSMHTKSEAIVSENIQRLEMALDDLNQSVGEASRKLERIAEIGKRQREQIFQMKSRSRVEPFITRTREIGQQVAMQVSARPRPILLSALVAVVGGVFLAALASRNRSSTVASRKAA